jgi:hypothetical protein
VIIPVWYALASPTELHGAAQGVQSSQPPLRECWQVEKAGSPSTEPGAGQRPAQLVEARGLM